MAKSILWVATVVVILSSPAHAQTPRISNNASGFACYSVSDLRAVHSALGFYDFARVEQLQAQKKCFFMQKAWKARIEEEQVIRGTDVKMVRVRLVTDADIRFAWSLLKNFDFAGD
ncbi:MAG: hypothetical protein OXP28_01790 [Gammaproteobacteria bacterium]|nr:hypothetical protein [Gammaproteobacteria bacterium]